MSNQNKEVKIVIYGTERDPCSPIYDPGYTWKKWNKSMGQISTRFQLYETPDKVVLFARENMGLKWDITGGVDKFLDKEILENLIDKPSAYNASFNHGVLDIIGFNLKDEKIDPYREISSDKDLRKECSIIINSGRIKGNIKASVQRFVLEHGLNAQTKLYLPESIEGSLDWDHFCATKNLSQTIRYGNDGLLKKAVAYHMKSRDKEDWAEALKFAKRISNPSCAKKVKDVIDERYKRKAWEILDGVARPDVLGGRVELSDLERLSETFKDMGLEERAKEYTLLVNKIKALAKEDYKTISQQTFKSPEEVGFL